MEHRIVLYWCGTVIVEACAVMAIHKRLVYILTRYIGGDSCNQIVAVVTSHQAATRWQESTTLNESRDYTAWVLDDIEGLPKSEREILGEKL